MISPSLISILLGSRMIVAIADQAPEYDVAPSCRSLAMLSYSVETCMNDEKTAREKLMSRWTQFERSDKDTCEATTRAAGPSYVTLLNCLEIAEEVERPSRKPSRPSVDGQSPMTMEFSAAVTLFVAIRSSFRNTFLDLPACRDGWQTTPTPSETGT
jgi:hypothetical protein